MFEKIHAFFDRKTIVSKKMGIAWTLSLAAIISVSYVTKGSDVVFSGIAEATAITVSVPSAVEVIKLHVEVGEEVKDGDTLIELSRPDLALRMNELKRELDALEGRGNVSMASVDQKVAEIKADLDTRRNTLKFEIQKLESEYKQNLAIAARLKSLSGTGPSSENDAMAARIQSMKKELSVLEANAATQIRLLRGSKGKQAESNASEAKLLQKELERLQQEMKEQTILAKGEWVVGSILARDGEKVSSFNPLMTLTRKEPSLVRGYLHENLHSKIEVGDEVEVSTLGTQSKVRGKIVGMSSQIVPFPLRLLKSPDFPMYGREVNVAIPEHSGFLLGEKVSITELPDWKNLLNTSANNDSLSVTAP